MTVESVLTRQLGITFIDARSIATQAKLNLGFTCYLSSDQNSAVIDEATRIFGEYSANVRYNMLINKEDLDDVKQGSAFIVGRESNLKPFGSSSSDRSDYESSDWRFLNGLSTRSAATSGSLPMSTRRQKHRRRGSSLTRQSGDNSRRYNWSLRKKYES